MFIPLTSSLTQEEDLLNLSHHSSLRFRSKDLNNLWRQLQLNILLLGISNNHKLILINLLLNLNTYLILSLCSSQLLL